MNKEMIRPRWSAWFEDNKGVSFNYWFPSCQECLVRWEMDNVDGRTRLKNQDKGIFTGFEPKLRPKARYMIEAIGIGTFPDPYSLSQPEGVHKSSQIIDPALFHNHRHYTTGINIKDAIIYELHIGTFTDKGTYKALIDKLPYLKSLGVTVIELMPVGSFPGNRNWGYDSVMKYAPASCYGTESDLIKLIDAIHKEGLFVVLDVIYNHFGPDGNYLYPLSRDFFTSDQSTPWGDAIDFRKREVRDYFIDNARHWLVNYRFDGLRFDAIEAIWDETDKHIIKEVCQTAKQELEGVRQLLLTVENNKNQASMLGPDKADAQWNDDFHHALHVSLTGETDGYYIDFKDSLNEMERFLRLGFAFGERVSLFFGNKVRGEKGDELPPYRFIHSDQNHDQIGNRAFGERLIKLTSLPRVKFALALTLLCPGTPLLFMGEELFTDIPFLYFTNHNDELGRAVTEGRRKEFAGFESFSKTDISHIPDPQELDTFIKCKIQWNDYTKNQIEETIKLTQTCIDVRKRFKDDYAINHHPEVKRHDALFLISFGKLRLAFNLSEGVVEDGEGFFRPGIVDLNFSEEEHKKNNTVSAYSITIYEQL